MIGLFSPLTVKNLTLANRIVLPPMANNMSDDSGAVMKSHIQHYVRRAKTGIAMVIVEHAYICREGRVNSKQLGIHHDSLIPGLSELALAIKASGAVAGIQITHGGGKASAETADGSPFAPSAGIVSGGSEPAIELDTIEIAEIIDAFVTAAQRATAAGFDFVEIYGAHGYLLNQFLSPLSNHRTDAYGGDLQNRMRLPLDVTQAVRAAIGNDYLLLYRLGANDYKPGGITTAEGCAASQALVAAGIDILDISGGACGSQLPDWDGTSQGYFAPIAAAVRSVVNVPVIVVGGITNPHTADQFIRDGQADLIAIGRAMLTNPDWAAQAQAALKN